MSIFDKISQVADSQIAMSDKLNAIAAWLIKEYELQVNFCRIFGKRWSFISGDRNLKFAPLRRQLCPKYGLFYEQNDNLDDQTFEKILLALTRILTKIDN